MSSHTLTEKVAGLASRVNSLAAVHSGTDQRTLYAQQNQLIDLMEIAIVRDLDAADPNYQNALKTVESAISEIGEAHESADNVSKIIDNIAKAIAKLAKLLV
jgi:hypothetical protein